MAQSTSKTAPTKTATLPAGPEPTFVNSPGLMINSPQNGATVHQGQSVPVIAVFQNHRPIAGVIATLSKTDGTGNQSILESKPSIASLAFYSLWNISSDFPLGDHNVRTEKSRVLNS
ncbi:hypothetical protein BGZ83_007888 [Gryganskiella cystojenkinii]|nr:hypothetical protein BGZ83_007888 [Gryganskiella cystojenkinii]